MDPSNGPIKWTPQTDLSNGHINTDPSNVPVRWTRQTDRTLHMYTHGDLTKVLPFLPSPSQASVLSSPRLSWPPRSSWQGPSESQYPTKKEKEREREKLVSTG